MNHEGDLFRTRLTHSLEVAQLGRSIGRSLRLDEDLIEAIALAHDLGHTPFGHAGQDVLDECMKAHGGFEHNLQSLRVVDKLEQRYPAFDGLNLTFETREGILKHCARRHALLLEAAEPGGVAARFLGHGGQPSLEAQLCNLADEVAYNAHDIDDGVRAGLLTLAQLEAVPLVQRYLRDALAEHPTLGGKRLLFETIRRMLSAQVYDIIDTTAAALAAADPADVDAVRSQAPLITFSPAMRSGSSELKRFLFAQLYRHPQVQETRVRAEQVLRDLFAIYLGDPAQLPREHATTVDHPRACADYIAGMTDRFALREHQRLTGKTLF